MDELVVETGIHGNAQRGTTLRHSKDGHDLFTIQEWFPLPTGIDFVCLDGGFEAFAHFQTAGIPILVTTCV